MKSSTASAATGAVMEKREVTFLIAVFAFALVFLGMTWQETQGLLPTLGAQAGTEAAGTAGKPRDVDMRKLQDFLDRGFLTRRKALYYSEVQGGTAELQPSGAVLPPATR